MPQTEQTAAAPYVSGVRWSGLQSGPVYTPSAAEVARRQAAQTARAIAFAKSPRGQFCACIEELEQTGYTSEADRLRGYYARSISTLNAPDPDPSAIGSCVLILNEIGTPVARAGIKALVGLLVRVA